MSRIPTAHLRIISSLLNLLGILILVAHWAIPLPAWCVLVSVALCYSAAGLAVVVIRRTP